MSCFLCSLTRAIGVFEPATVGFKKCIIKKQSYSCHKQQNGRSMTKPSQPLSVQQIYQSSNTSSSSTQTYRTRQYCEISVKIPWKFRKYEGGIDEGSKSDGYLLQQAQGDLEIPHAPPGSTGKKSSTVVMCFTRERLLIIFVVIAFHESYIVAEDMTWHDQLTDIDFLREKTHWRYFESQNADARCLSLLQAGGRRRCWIPHSWFLLLSLVAAKWRLSACVLCCARCCLIYGYHQHAVSYNTAVPVAD